MFIPLTIATQLTTLGVLTLAAVRRPEGAMRHFMTQEVVDQVLG